LTDNEKRLLQMIIRKDNLRYRPTSDKATSQETSLTKEATK
jgi:hypothetical protein